MITRFFVFVLEQIMMAAHRCGRMDPAAVVNFFETMTQEGRFQVKNPQWR